MSKRRYLNLLLQMKPAYLRDSAANPTQYMQSIHIKLHYVALRRMGEL